MDFLNPSLVLLGTKLSYDSFGFSKDSKYTQLVYGKDVRKIFSTVGLKSLVQQAGQWSENGTPLWRFYQLAQKELGRKILSILDYKVDFEVVNFEDLCKETEYWSMSAPVLGRLVRRALGHDVVLFNTPHGMQLKTDSAELPNESVSRLYSKGWWLSGAATHTVIYSLARFGGLVVLVKDSSAGLVNITAREFLMRDDCQLYVTPAGLFRLPAKGQSLDWSIDPFVLLELLNRWGISKSKHELTKIWNAMEVPLSPRNIGKKTVAIVGLDGVQVEISK